MIPTNGSLHCKAAVFGFRVITQGQIQDFRKGGVGN